MPFYAVKSHVSYCRFGLWPFLCALVTFAQQIFLYALIIVTPWPEIIGTHILNRKSRSKKTNCVCVGVKKSEWKWKQLNIICPFWMIYSALLYFIVCFNLLSHSAFICLFPRVRLHHIHTKNGHYILDPTIVKTHARSFMCLAAFCEWHLIIYDFVCVCFFFILSFGIRFVGDFLLLFSWSSQLSSRYL